MPSLGVISTPARINLPLRMAKSNADAETYLMVFPVRNRIHWGMGRFCFWARASFCFVRKDLWLCGCGIGR